MIVNRVKALLNGEQAPDDRQAFVALITRLVALPNELLPDSCLAVHGPSNRLNTRFCPS
jgi:hypothetical protein